MLGMRLFAIAIPGLLVFTGIDSDDAVEQLIGSGDIEFTFFSADEESREEYEEVSDEHILLEENYLLGDDLDKTLDDIVVDDVIADDEWDYDTLYSVRFYPGEGKLISTFSLCEDVQNWEYDVSDGVMTIYSLGAPNALSAFDYSLEVPDGTRTFAGWYFDEELTEKADFLLSI